MSGGIDFGGLDLTGIEDYDGVLFEAMGDGATLGNPQSVDRSVLSSLLDGSFVVTDSHDNREASFQVWIRASDSAALAHGEKMLFDRCSRPVEFGWTPPDGWGARTVFEAFTSHLEHEFDDLKEINQLVRSYRLRIVCYPFGFSEDEVVDVAVPFTGTPTTTVISDGTSTTGWSTNAPAAVSTSGGKLRVSAYASSSSPADFGYTQSLYDFTASKVLSPVVDFTATEYVTADLAVEYASATFTATVDGSPLQQVSMVLLSQTEVAYTYRVTWRCRDTSASLLTINALGGTLLLAGQFPAGDPTLVIDNVQRSNRVPMIADTTGHKSLRQIAVTGSARTMGSAQIEHETTGLGDVLFYTSNELGTGYDPDLDRWFDPASTSSIPDADALSGLSVGLSTASSPDGADWNVPANMLPSGPHLLMLQASSLVGGPLTWTISTVIGSTLMATQTGTVQIEATGEDFVLVPMCVATLPTVKIPGEGTAVVRITLSSPQEVRAGGLLSYFIGDGADLTHVKAGAGTPALGSVHSRLYLEAPSLSNDGAPGLFVGVAANGSDGFHPGYPAVQSWGRHPFAPPITLAHVVTTAATFARVTLRHRPAWFTHAGQ